MIITLDYFTIDVMELFVLWGTYCEDAIEKRIPFRDEHLTRLSKLKEEGIVITLGPTKCTRYIFGIFNSENVESLRNILEDDVYWKEGIWTNLEIYPWVQAF